MTSVLFGLFIFCSQGHRLAGLQILFDIEILADLRSCYFLCLKKRMTGCIILLSGAQRQPYEYLFQPLPYRMVMFPSYQRSTAVSVTTPAE